MNEEKHSPIEPEKPKKEYNPIGCEHKKDNGWSAWEILSDSNGSGPDLDYQKTIMVCMKCGDIRCVGRDLKHGKINHFDEIFDIDYPDAVAAIVKACNWFNKDTEGYMPFTQSSPIEPDTYLQPVKDEYRTEATWFDNYQAYWIINKRTDKPIAMALGKTLDEAAGNSIKIINALSSPPEPASNRFKSWLEERVENYEAEKELYGKKERIQARLSMLIETLENYNRWNVEPSSKEQEGPDIDGMFKWAKENHYHFDGENFDENTGHDDFETYTPNEFYNLYKQSK